MHRAQKHVEVVTNGAVVVPARTAVGYRTTWRERQPAIVEQLAGVVELALEQTRRSLHEGRMRDAQHGAVTAGICVDKVLLLTGQATTRSEQFRVNVDATDIAAKIRALEVELGYKPRELE